VIVHETSTTLGHGCGRGGVVDIWRRYAAKRSSRACRTPRRWWFGPRSSFRARAAE
jgi:hypothetical protein